MLSWRDKTSVSPVCWWLLGLQIELIKPVFTCDSHKDRGDMGSTTHLSLPLASCYFSPCHLLCPQANQTSEYHKIRTRLIVFVSYTVISLPPPISDIHSVSFHASCLALCLYCTWGPGGRRTSLQSRPRCHPHVICWIITARTWGDSEIHKSWAQIKKDKCKPEHAAGRSTGAVLLHLLTVHSYFMLSKTWRDHTTASGMF